MRYDAQYVAGPAPDPSYPPTYIVTGFMRSGTSMMMRAAYEGMGRVVEMVTSDERREKLNSGETIPNHEYLEPRLEDFETPEFPRFHEGKLLKCLMAGMHPLWPMRGGIHVVQMWRDPSLIRESWLLHESAFGPPPPWLPDGYLKRMAACSHMLRNRRDVLSHTDLFFPEVVASPVSVVGQLRNAGWPIVDEDAFVGVIDPSRMSVGV